MTLIDTHFTDNQVYTFAFAFLAGAASLVFFLREQYRWALGLLFVAGLSLRLMMTAIDPFLNFWDEQFHALVAKNVLHDPLHPMMYVHPVLPYDYSDWAKNHIWLHKQPLFLWIIALSYKIFGVTEIALRLPAAVFSALMIPMIYRMGTIVVNRRVGWLAAALFCFSTFFVQIITGAIHTDQNDNIFLFFVTGSCWCLFEYIQDRKNKWMILIGVFAGCAVMTKWLTGLLVFSGWGLYLLLDRESRFRWKAWLPLLISLAIAVIIVLPWQLYIMQAYPVESAYEYKLNSLHFTIAVEGHEGPPGYHFSLMFEQYGWLAPYLFIPGCVLLWYFAGDRKKALVLIMFPVLIYGFFTLAKTKMPLFTLPAAPALFTALGAVAELAMRGMAKIPIVLLRNVVCFAGIFIALFASLNMSGAMEENHTGRNPKNTYWYGRIYDTKIDKEIGGLLPSKDYVLFNAGGMNAMLVMFYNDGVTAYCDYMTEKEYHELKARHVKIAVCIDEQLPEFLANDPEVFKIDRKLVRL